jgi:hypothetical protein
MSNVGLAIRLSPADPKPFIWAATVQGIVQSISPARTKLEQIKPGSQWRPYLRDTLLAVTVRHLPAA